MQTLLSSLQTAISFDSSTKKGAVACLNWVLNLAKDMGFRTRNLDNMVGWAEYGEGEELITVLGHLDVVPAGSGWTKDPFGGEIVDGRLYGRGATDDKGPMLAALYALKAIKDQGLPLKRRVRLLFGTEEETGCQDMKYYVEHGGEVPTFGFTPDGEFPLIHGEKGILIETYRCTFAPGQISSLWGGTAANMVPDAAYAVLPDGSRLEAAGVAAHGAEPWNGKNAIGVLLQKLQPLPFTGQLKTALQFLHSRIGTETDGASLGIAMADEISGPLSFNMGMLRGDEQSLEVTVNYRYPVTKDYVNCAPQVQAAFAQAGFTQTQTYHDEKLFIPETSPLIEKLLGVYNSYLGTQARPICIGGGTYAKSMPNTVAFGPIFPGDEMTEHRPDEYIALDRLQQNFDLIRLAILALAEA